VDFCIFLGSLDFCFFVPVLNHVLTIGQDLFSIKTMKLETIKKKIEENTFDGLVPKIS
jgi:hypothetical protein